jgi:nicotinamidase-related amidase
MHELKISPNDALLLVVDMQERLAAAMPEEGLGRVTRSVVTLVNGARHLSVPALATEQYPRGLGPTLPAVREALAAHLGAPVIEKLAFSCQQSKEVAAALRAAGRRQIIVCGMETHVCVYQTARDLIAAGLQVFVPQDAVLSRTAENRDVGLRLIERAGGVITSTEAVLFDLLGAAGTPAFKAISALVK